MGARDPSADRTEGRTRTALSAQTFGPNLWDPLHTDGTSGPGRRGGRPTTKELGHTIMRRSSRVGSISGDGSACGTGDLPNSPVMTVPLTAASHRPTVQNLCTKPVLRHACWPGGRSGSTSRHAETTTPRGVWWDLFCSVNPQEERPMCRQVTCRRCGNATWAGCGQHVNQVMAGVSKSKRCQCPPKASFVERIFGGRKSSE